jgi:hypothetical protein
VAALESNIHQPNYGINIYRLLFRRFPANCGRRASSTQKEWSTELGSIKKSPSIPAIKASGWMPGWRSIHHHHSGSRIFKTLPHNLFPL